MHVQYKVYSEEDHLSRVDENIKELYLDLKTSILNFHPDITIKPTKNHIAFRRSRMFAGIHFATSSLMIHFKININELQDPQHIAKSWSRSNESKITITTIDEIPYAISLIKQAYERR
jgi:predicted transport protein